jgi:uncharacterized protein DUF4389
MSELPPEQPPAEPVVTTAAALEPGADHPVRLVVTDDLKRSRLTVFFRLLLVIPHIIWWYLWGIAASVVLLVGWFAALFIGRLPDGMHNFLTKYQRYTTHLYAYLALLANPYPPFNGQPGIYTVDLHVDPPQPQPRWTILLRIVLAIPAFILAWVFSQVRFIVSFLGWFVCIVMGRMPKGMRDLGLYCLRYEQQTTCYVWLLTKRYPSLSGPTP